MLEIISTSLYNYFGSDIMFMKVFRSIITVASLFFLVWFIAPFVMLLVLNPGNILGVLICLFLIFRFGFEKKYNSVKEFFYRNKFSKFLWRFFSVIVALFSVYAVVISGFIVGFSLKAPAENSSPTAVVLGAEVKPWGASALLQQRIDAAEQYLKAHPKASAVLTGGQGANEPVSEAQCMYESLVKQGISPERLLIEDKAANTKENIEFSYRIIKDKNLNKNMAIVTDSYHQFRARIIAEKQRIHSEIYAVNSHNNKTGILCYPTMLVREWIAIPVEIIK